MGQFLFLWKLFRSFGFDGLIQSAIGAVAHFDHDRLAIDFHFALLQIDVPTAAGSPQRVAARISADRTLSGDGAISGHGFTSRAMAKGNIP